MLVNILVVEIHAKRETPFTPGNSGGLRLHIVEDINP